MIEPPLQADNEATGGDAALDTDPQSQSPPRTVTDANEPLDLSPFARGTTEEVLAGRGSQFPRAETNALLESDHSGQAPGVILHEDDDQ